MEKLSISIILYVVIFIVGLISDITNNSIAQIFGSLLIIILCLLLHVNIILLAVTILTSLIFLYFDESFFSSKVILYIGFIFLFNINNNYYVNNFKRNLRYINIDFILKLFILINICQILVAQDSIGLFGIERASIFTWDPNYFSVFILFIYFGFTSTWIFSFINVVLSQSVSNIVPLFFLRIKNNINYLIFIVSILLIICFYILKEYSFDATGVENEWLKQRFISFSLRMQWAIDIINGELDPEIAPHISIFSGLKKNMIFTCLYFFILFKTGRKKYFFPPLLVSSMGVDVFFGPFSFLYPLLFLAPTKDGSLKK